VPVALLAIACEFLPHGTDAAAFRDELTFFGRTTYLFREYALVVPVDLKRQPVQAGTFLEIKAWGAWNGRWVPYLYEPITVPIVPSDDVNAILTQYRQMKPDATLDVRKEPDNAFLIASGKAGSRFQLWTPGFIPRLTAENREGSIRLGRAPGTLTLGGKGVTGQVAFVLVTPTPRSDPAGRYGLYDHFTLQLASGDVLVVYHSRNRPGFNLGAPLTTDGKSDRRTRETHVTWRKFFRDSESGRDVPTAWSVESFELALNAELEEWGRNLVRYRTDAGKTAVVSNSMVRGTVEIAGRNLDAFILNVHVQDE
jgi:hypothetical protein